MWRSCGCLLALLLVHVTHSAESWTDDEPSSPTYTELNKPCPVGCVDFGNCNAELGVCECPFGRAGPACEDDALARSCSASSAPPLAPSCGRLVQKSCTCRTLCRSAYCGLTLIATDPASLHSSPTASSSYDNCTHDAGRQLQQLPCYEIPAAAALPRVPRLSSTSSSSSSAYPVDLAATEWYSANPLLTCTAGDPSAAASCRAALRLAPPATAPPTSGGAAWLDPATACPTGCSGRGACLQDPGAAAAPRCVCRQGYNGTACERVDAEGACWFSPTCGGRGACVGGFCHCQAGFWGTGCERSRAWALPASTAAAAWPVAPDRSRPRVYMYSLPWQVAFPGEMDDGVLSRDSIYTAEEYWVRYLLQDGATLTDNPWEANLFYMPAHTFFYSGNVGDSGPHLRRVLSYVRQAYGFYNRTGGRDHFWFTPGDLGTCSLPRDLQDAAITVTHFGLSLRPRHANSGHFTHNQEYGCYLSTRDVVTAPVGGRMSKGDPAAEASRLQAVAGASNRTTLLLFVGGTRDGSPKYSGGARQALRAYLDRNPDDSVIYVPHVPQYGRLLLRSHFCFCPYGAGWGQRIVTAMLHFCIPVVVQDGVHQPFSDTLPWHEFSLRFSVADVKHLVPMLHGIAPARRDALRAAMSRHWSAFHWQRERVRGPEGRRQGGGTAYEHTLEALYRRMQGLWAGM